MWPRFTNICLQFAYISVGGSQKGHRKALDNSIPEWLTKCQHSSQRPTPNLRWRQGWEVSNFHWSDRTNVLIHLSNNSLKYVTCIYSKYVKLMNCWNDNPYFKLIFLWISYGFMFLDCLGFISNLGLMISSVCKSEWVFQGLGDEHRKNASGPLSGWGSVISWDDINSKRNKQMTPERTKQYQAILLHTNS